MSPTFHIENDLSFQDQERIHQEQERLLNEHLAYCRAKSPYYRRLLADLPNCRVKLTELEQLPLTDKKQLATANNDFIAAAPTELADICFTSGTTGRPCRIVYTQADLERLAHNDALGFQATGMQKTDVVLLTCTIDRCFIAGLAYYLGVQKLGATAVRNGLNSLESHSEIISNGDITCLVGVPSFLVKLGQHLRHNKIDSRQIHKVICIGEPLRDRQLQLTSLGQQLEHLWPGACFSTYASSEIVTSFTECQQRHGGHAPADLAIVEIIDQSGRPVPPGQEGEVTVTPLQVTGMPLLRFRTGDISFQILEKCPCGRNTPRLGPILGRQAQMLKVKGTTIFPNAIFQVLDEIKGIDNYYMEVTGDSLSDKIELYVATQEENFDNLKVQEKLYARNRLQIKVHPVSREHAQQKVFGSSRKPTRFFDGRQK